MAKYGYDDTPFLPNTKWRVHDSNRPQPPVIWPGWFSTQEAPGEPPSDAIILFDGKDLSKWVSVKDGSPARWKVENGYMEVVPGRATSEPLRSLAIANCTLNGLRPLKFGAKGKGEVTAVSSSWGATKFKSLTATRTQPMPMGLQPQSTVNIRHSSMPAASPASGKFTTSFGLPQGLTRMAISSDPHM
jgi:hypothetical protein